MAPGKKSDEITKGQEAFSAPSISLPKGGGAIRGIGEKFAANPVTGTGSLTVLIATSPGRSGFGPQLSLSYDSGSGNGPFGFGWSLSIPAITRKTDKGLPQYLDAKESDAFILSGAEDLVPVLQSDRTRFKDKTTHPDYTIHRYRPRIEGLFARIERWTRSDGEVHWRSISKENILTLYGKDENSRIADPNNPRRIFSWLICETRDDKGNAVIYRYKSENGDGVDLTRANERNRGDRDDPRRAANRYVKHIQYGNRTPLLDDQGKRPWMLTTDQINAAGWMFEVVFDYGEHDETIPRPGDMGEWTYRADPFSTYRSGFEVRTTRLCQRVLMFHDFEAEQGVGNDCLVRSTDFTYSHEQDPENACNPIYTFLREVTQSGYKRDGDGYLKKSLPPVAFEYTQPVVQDTAEVVDPASLENLPMGVDGAAYQWTDLHGEGIPGILTEQAGEWFYKRNLSPIGEDKVEFAPLETVAVKPNLETAAGAQFMDLAGDGQPDLIMLDGPLPGLYEHDVKEGWHPFRPFTSRLNRNMQDPNLKLVDLNGDGHADVLITEDHALVWHASLTEEGFGPERRIANALDEEKGPRLVFADGTQSIYLADLSGDGLTDLVRLRNGEVCYWPNLGYGRFGAKITMDHSPCFDHPDQFDQKRIRLADIDGTGTVDIIYLHAEGVRLYFNQSGNAWSEPTRLNIYPQVDNLVSILPTDLLGNGTACLVWSSPLPGDKSHPMRYVNLMGGKKPHLLVKSVNNLGAETRVHYVPSTKFYLQDRQVGKPWITRLPFPVHVVEGVETYDHISRNRFVTRYAYHHGYFDGEEREFRGFGMVEQWDTEAFAALTGDGDLPEGTNIDAASHVPPVLTKTWFHTGIYLGRKHVSNYFAGLLDEYDTGEYYREPGLDDDQARALLLPDTVLPRGLSVKEEREACRSLKGAMLRQEIFALDGTPKAEIPYTVTEQNFSIRCLQTSNGNRHAVFFTHARETITYHYERNPADPRTAHAMTLEVDDFGNVLKQVAIGYGRRQTLRTVDENGVSHEIPNPSLEALSTDDQSKQTQTLITYTENQVTNAIEDVNEYPLDYRTPLPCETRTYELTGFVPEEGADRFSFDELTRSYFDRLNSAEEIAYEDTPNGEEEQKRLVEHARILYRRDDLAGLLEFGQVQPLALPGESYKFAFTPGLLDIFQRDGQTLLSEPSGQELEEGGYVVSSSLKADGRFPETDPDDYWWIPSGRTFLAPEDENTDEQTFAREHFFLPHRWQDPFGAKSHVRYDDYDLIPRETRDALANRVTVGERNETGEIDPVVPGIDYRVLQASKVTGPNGNLTQVAFDTLGMLVGTALMGKRGEDEGDSLEGFDPDLSPEVIADHLEDPLGKLNEELLHEFPHDILGNATTRLVYDLDAYANTKDELDPNPPVVYTLVRETHVSDLDDDQKTKVQHSLSYSDGFGREIQKKIQAEPGPLDLNDPNSPHTDPRWVGSGWTIFNNKGKPVRQYKPFFTATHRFEFGVEVGVSPIIFYDPIGRAVATLHPNHTYEKVLFGPWQQETWDVNDTVLGDPRTDEHIQGYTAAYFAALPPEPLWQTWYERRIEGTLGEQERAAAIKAASHAETQSKVHLDTLGRPFLTVAHNKVDWHDPERVITEAYHHTRVEIDIEGNQLIIKDERNIEPDPEKEFNLEQRDVMRYHYSIAGPEEGENGEPTNTHLIHQSSMEAGERWVLNDVSGQPIRAWDSRGHTVRTEYDPLRRPLHIFVTGADPDRPEDELLTERLVYGEQHPDAHARNLRGMLYLHLDQAGAVANEDHDFKGNLLLGTRRLANEYKRTIHWQPVDDTLPADAKTAFDPSALEAALAQLLEDEIFSSRTRFDALNRPIQLIAPHSDKDCMKINVIQPGYNEANLLQRIDAWLNQASEPPDLLDPTTPHLDAVRNIDYDAKAQRTMIQYGNGAETRYKYDDETYQLRWLYTRRGTDFMADCANPKPPPNTTHAPPEPQRTCGLQNLHYTYDPAGNITHIRDDAQQTIYFANTEIKPYADYCYDALYRLIEATGREHLGQAGAPPTPLSHTDEPRIGCIHPNDGTAMARYTERYVYDAVGNFLQMQHRGSNARNAGWKRSYAYEEPSQIEYESNGTLLKTSNRLTRTTIDGTTETYSSDGDGYDAHGNMTTMPHLASMQWDYRDQLQATTTQVRNDGTPRTTYYVYDAAGQRVRKVTESEARSGEQPMRAKERIYLGGFEIFRNYEHDHGQGPLERETLHIMDDQQRIAFIETRTQGHDVSPEQLIRYQLGNHLGSVSLELDGDSQIISYEEYTPYGSTAYQAVRNDTETPAKRYRFTGKERDEESGLYYFGARYLSPWLGRWVSTDPLQIRLSIELAGSRGSHGIYIGKTCSAREQQTTNTLLLKSVLKTHPRTNSELANLYAYVRCNPLRFIDVEGLQAGKALQWIVKSAGKEPIFKPTDVFSAGITVLAATTESSTLDLLSKASIGYGIAEWLVGNATVIGRIITVVSILYDLYESIVPKPYYPFRWRETERGYQVDRETMEGLIEDYEEWQEEMELWGVAPSYIEYGGYQIHPRTFKETYEAYIEWKSRYTETMEGLINDYREWQEEMELWGVAPSYIEYGGYQVHPQTFKEMYEAYIEHGKKPPHAYIIAITYEWARARRPVYK